MDLEEARALKQSVMRDVVEPLVASKLKSLSLAFAAGDLSTTRSSHPQRVMAMGISKTEKGYGLAVRLQRHSLLDRPELERLRKASRGELDLRFVGRIHKRATVPWQQERRRPLQIGCSVAHHHVTAGTLGAFVRRAGHPGDLFILSNNHVLANENQGAPGDPILQPGPYDGGKAKDAVAELSAFVRLKKRGNLVDCAIGRLLLGAKDVKLNALKGMGTLAGVSASVDIGMEVRKIGRTTGLTHGRITAIELDDVVVAFGAGNFSFDQQIEIEGAHEESFSDGGDSGSLIVDAENRAVALLFAGSETGGTNGLGLTYANPVTPVLDALKIELASASA